MADVKLSTKATVTAVTDGSLDKLPVVIDGTPKTIRQITRNALLQLGHAEIYGLDVSPTQVLPTSTPAKHTAFATDGLDHLAVADAANDKITVADAGRYWVEYNATVSVDVACTVFAIAFVAGSAVALKDEQDIGTTRGRLHFAGFVDIGSGSVDVDVRLLGSAGSTLTTRQVRLSVRRIVQS